jgi:hypothetical protein
MKTQLNLTGDSKTLDALSRFLAALETVQPESITQPKAICGEDNVIYVEVEYRTEEDSFLVGDHMAEIGAEIVEETDIWVALAPFVVAEPMKAAEEIQSQAVGSGLTGLCCPSLFSLLDGPSPLRVSRFNYCAPQRW